MFSKLRNFLRRNVSVRLTAWYCGFFVLSLLILYVLVYLALASTLRKKDRELIRAKLKEFAEEYGEQGVKEIRQHASEKSSAVFFVRVADAQNRTLYLNAPDDDELTPDVLRAVEKAQANGARWMQIPLSHNDELEMAGSALRGGVFLQVGRRSHARHAFLTHFRRICVVVILPVVLFAVCGGVFLAQRALQPIHRLNQTVQAIIETGKMDACISTRNTTGELRELVVSFNLMLEQIQRLITGMRDVLDNVAHDLRTPLTRLRGIAEQALQNPGDRAASLEALADCIEESERVITMLNTLMDISEVETGAMKLHLTRVSISTVIAQLLDLYRDVAEEKEIELSSSASSDGTVLADENRLRQAVGNLLDNAIKYTPRGGKVHVEVQRANGQVIVGVRDSGIGIPAEEIPHVWERLYRGDKSRSERGLGLGLALVKAIAEAHDGLCEVQSAAGAGSLFTLRLRAA